MPCILHAQTSAMFEASAMFPFSRAAAAGSWQALSASPSRNFSRFISALISSTSLLSPLNSWKAVSSSSSVADFFKLASWTVSTMIFSTSSFDTTLHSSTFWLLQRGFGTGFSGAGGLGTGFGSSHSGFQLRQLYGLANPCGLANPSAGCISLPKMHT